MMACLRAHGSAHQARASRHDCDVCVSDQREHAQQPHDGCCERCHASLSALPAHGNFRPANGISSPRSCCNLHPPMGPTQKVERLSMFTPSLATPGSSYGSSSAGSKACSEFRSDVQVRIDVSERCSAETPWS